MRDAAAGVGRHLQCSCSCAWPALRRLQRLRHHELQPFFLSSSSFFSFFSFFLDNICWDMQQRLTCWRCSATRCGASQWQQRRQRGKRFQWLQAACHHDLLLITDHGPRPRLQVEVATESTRW